MDYKFQAALQDELRRRRSEDQLLAFKPHKKQSPFIKEVLAGTKTNIWYCGANRCITPWTPLETGSATRLPVEFVGEKGFDVQSWDGSNRCTKKASALFLKGIEPAFRLHLDNGEAFECSYKHRVLTPVGWVCVGCLLSIPNGRRWMGKLEDYRANCDVDGHQCGQVPRLWIESGIKALRQEADALPRNLKDAAQTGVVAPTPEHIRAYLGCALPASSDDPLLLSGLFGLWKPYSSRTTYQSCSYELEVQPPSLSGSALARQEAITQIQDHVFEDACYSLPYPIPLFGGVKIVAYQKIGLHPIIDFTVEETGCYYAAGAVHHNSGKSEAGSYCGAHLARFGSERNKDKADYSNGMIVRDFATSGWVVSLDFPNSRDVIQPKYFDNGFIPPGGNEPFIPKREIKEWRSTDQILKLKNGSLIGFKSADSPASKFQGAGKDWVHFDEVPPKEHHDETVMRVEAGRKLVVFGTCTLLPPVGMAGGVSWLYLTTIKPWQEGKRDDVAVFTAGIRDNPFIGEEEIKGLESIHPPGSRQHDIRIMGKLVPGIGGSRAYHSFERTVHVRELGEMDPYKPVAWTWDFNVQPMATLVGQREQERFKFFYELILEEGNIPDMCEYFYNIMLNMTHRSEIWVYGDATGTHRNAQYGESDYRIIQNSMAKYGVPFRMKVPRNGVNPPVAERLGAMNRAMKDEVGESRIEVDPRCTELITDFENVLLEPHGGIKKSHNVKDPYYARTHTSDAAGYWVTYEAPIRRFLAKQSSGPKSVRGASYSFGTKPLV